MVHGRDKHHRPIVIVRPMVATRLGVADPEVICRTVCFAAFYVMNYMYRDGAIENNICVFDLEKASPFQLPIKALRVFSQTMEQQFRCKNAHVYCFNVSTTFILGWGAIRSFLDPLIVSKTMLVAENTCPSIQSFVNPDQLLEDYGGTSKLPEQLWPPVIPNPLRQTVMHKLEVKLDETTSDRL